MIFRVHVDCWYVAKPRALCERRIVLVEAPNAHAARARAEHYAEHSAACSHHLSAVEWRSTEPLAFPLDVVGGAAFAPASAFRNLDEPKRKSRHAIGKKP